MFDPLTYRFKRSRVEAFGPYADQQPLYVRDDFAPMPKEDRIVIRVSAVAAVAVLLLAVFKALPGAGA